MGGIGRSGVIARFFAAVEHNGRQQGRDSSGDRITHRGARRNRMRTGDDTTDTLDVAADMLDDASDVLDVAADTPDNRADMIGKWPLPPDCGADRLDSGGRLADGPAGVPDRMSDRENKQSHTLDDVSHPGGRSVDTLDNRRRRPDGAG